MKKDPGRRTLFHRTTVFRILLLPLLLFSLIGRQRRGGVHALAPSLLAVPAAGLQRSSSFFTFLGSSSTHKPHSTKLAAFATADAEDIHRARDGSNNDNDDSSSSSSWTPVQGGFLPRFRTPPPVTPLVREIHSLQDYRDIVVRAPASTITVVRFYAPWCRACKAVQAKFQRLSRQYADAAAASSQRPKVQFVQVPLTSETAVLHTGLGVPSLPYGHIYYNGLLMEERKINKHVFDEFEAVLQTYVQGSCPVQYNNDNTEGGVVVEWLR